MPREMEDTTFFLFISFICICIHLSIRQLGHRISSRLPPGPYPLPVIGNILNLGDKPHQSLTTLSKTHGPLMSLKFGSTTTIVVSSPEIAKQFFGKHDKSFSGRPVADTSRAMDHHNFSVSHLAADDLWRKLRRICKEHVFPVKQLDASHVLRQRKVQELIDHVHRCCASGGTAVNIGAAVYTTTLNILSNFIFSVDLDHYDGLTSQEFKEAISGLLELEIKPNVSDFISALQPFDLQRLRQKAYVYRNKIKTIFEGIINQRLHDRDNSSLATTDVLDALLDLSQENDLQFDQNNVIHLILDLFIAGTDTVSVTLEWAMAELIRNPDKMARARLELEESMGKDKKILEEKDMSRLPYLQAVVKETLRLHPAGPFLVPHKSIRDVEIQGFVVPKDSRILYNVWAIGRDPRVWSCPLIFMPERFLDADIDYKGQDFELIPFGSGRRICPGLPLAHRILNFTLGSLICKFDWKLEGEMKVEEMDMSESFGLSLQKAVPLKAIPIKI